MWGKTASKKDWRSLEWREREKKMQVLRRELKSLESGLWEKQRLVSRIPDTQHQVPLLINNNSLFIHEEGKEEGVMDSKEKEERKGTRKTRRNDDDRGDITEERGGDDTKRRNMRDKSLSLHQMQRKKKRHYNIQSVNEVTKRQVRHRLLRQSRNINEAKRRKSRKTNAIANAMARNREREREREREDR